mgnify:FL=1
MKPRLSARTSRRLQLASFAAAILLLLAAWAAAQCMPPAETPLPSEEADASISIEIDGTSEEADASISIEIDGTPAAKAEASLAPLDAACFALCGAAIVLLLAGQVQAWFFYRCPHCAGSLLRVRGPMPEFCPHCGNVIGQ